MLDKRANHVLRALHKIWSKRGEITMVNFYRKDKKLTVPASFLGRILNQRSKARLASIMGLRALPYGATFDWATIRALLLDAGYAVTEGKVGLHSYSIINAQ